MSNLSKLGKSLLRSVKLIKPTINRNAFRIADPKVYLHDPKVVFGINELNSLLKDLESGKINHIFTGSSLRVNILNIIKNLDLLREAAQNTSYARALLGDNLYKELIKAGREEENIDFDKDKIQTYFKNIVWPLIADNIRQSGAYVPRNKWNQLVKMFSNPLEGVDMARGYTMPGSGGYSSGSYFIRFPFDTEVTEGVIAHELHHSLRNRMGLILEGNNFAQSPYYNFEELLSTNPKRAKILRNYPQYFDLEKDIMKRIGSFTDSQRADLTPASEIGASIAGDTKFDLWNTLAGELLHYPTREELYKKIDSMSPNEAVNYYNDHSYGRWLMNNKKFRIGGTEVISGLRRPIIVSLDSEKFIPTGEAIKEGLKRIGGAAIPIGTTALGGYMLNNVQSAKYGKKLIKRK